MIIVMQPEADNAAIAAVEAKIRSHGLDVHISRVTVLLPEFVVRHWWGNILHNQTALLLKGRLLFRKGTVVTSLPYHLE